MNIQLLSSIARGVWAMEPLTAKGYYPLVQQLKERTPVAFYQHSAAENADINTPSLISASGIRKLKNAGNSVDEPSVFVVKLSGVVMKEDNCGVPGTATLRKNLMAADKEPSVIAHIISMDSGGGSVNGLEEFAEAVKGLSKPVYGYVDGMACSAAYYCMAHCEEIFLSSTAAVVGSIGTMMAFINWSNSKKVHGFEEVILNANVSPDKNFAYLKAKEGEYAPMKAELDKYAKAFQNTVREGRSGVKEDALTGSTYMGEEAIKMGLVDGIRTLEEIAGQLLNNHYKNQKRA